MSTIGFRVSIIGLRISGFLVNILSKWLISSLHEHALIIL